MAQLRAWIAEAAPPGGRCARIVVESTGRVSWRFARAWAGRAEDAEPRVAIVNPRRPKAFGVALGVREKSDRVDAPILALYGSPRRPKPTRLRDATSEALRELTRLREAYVADHTAWENRRREADAPPARRVLAGTLKQLEGRIEKIETDIDDLLATDPVLCRQVRGLQSIPGIGPVTARTLTSELGDLRRYSRGELVALAGLFPRDISSGSSLRRPAGLAKDGGARPRRACCTWRPRRCCAPTAPFARRSSASAAPDARRCASSAS